MNLPTPSNKNIAVHVTPAAEKALRDGHPWVFDQSIRKQSHLGQPGDLAVIFDQKRRFLAIGLYDPHSPIRVKVLQHHQQATINRAWFADKIQSAAARRQGINATGYRLVHGENDGLPGLVIDRYADTLVIKLYSAAWLPHFEDVIAVLPAHDNLVMRMSRQMMEIAALYGLQDGQVLQGEVSAPVIFEENGLRFAADVIAGHKTGYFFDQRENRAAVRQLASGRSVLDVFAYSGGFSVYAAAGGATSVLSMDISAPALEAALYNFELNDLTPPEIMVSDAFAGLEQLALEGRRFDIVIVDPPSFAKSQSEVDGALASYGRLASLALKVIAPGGKFVMASCSSRVPAEDFYRVVRSAGSLTDVTTRSHAADHPIGFPEGEYLKCLFATVLTPL
jgi:23S rRNA (cytosine1962-C5)-methyltransferase